MESGLAAMQMAEIYESACMILGVVSVVVLLSVWWFVPFERKKEK